MHTTKSFDKKSVPVNVYYNSNEVLKMPKGSKIHEKTYKKNNIFMCIFK